jgi:predicted DNA-binding protein
MTAEQKKALQNLKASTSLNLNQELYKEAKIEAIREGKTVSELVEEALDAWIKEHKKK